MADIKLLYSTGLPAVDALLRGSIGILEMVFPGRIRGYYLVGSYADGSFTPVSDIDLVPLFKGGPQEGEAERYWQALDYLNLLSPIRLGYGLRNEEQSFREGGIGITIGSVLVYGEDVRERIPLWPIEQYRRFCVSTSISGILYLRGNPGRVTYPLGYPDAQGAFYGYDKEMEHAGGKKGTAALFTYVMFYASTLATLKTGKYHASKSFSWRFYQENVGDA